MVLFPVLAHIDCDARIAFMRLHYCSRLTTSVPEMKPVFRYRIGDTWLCVENGNGYAFRHPSHVTVTLRTNRSDGRPGRRIAVNGLTQRDEILALGLRLLELADGMLPEGSVLPERVAGGEGVASASPSLGASDREFIDRLSADKPIDFARYVLDCAERLRGRMPILRAAQSVLENCNDETAKRLQAILSVADMFGCLPAIPGFTVATAKPSSAYDPATDSAALH